jgi:hypothetical protein
MAASYQARDLRELAGNLKNHGVGSLSNRTHLQQQDCGQEKNREKDIVVATAGCRVLCIHVSSFACVTHGKGREPVRDHGAEDDEGKHDG